MLVPLLPLLQGSKSSSTSEVTAAAAARPDPAPAGGGFKDELLAERATDAEWEAAIQRIHKERAAAEAAEAARQEAARVAAAKKAAEAKAAAQAKAKRDAEAKRKAAQRPTALAASRTGNSETGRASWYSAAPQTCAHRTLPIGTVVTVVNLGNGRSATCKVTGRGPFINGRVIDLDKQTFGELANTSQGVIDVRIEW